MHEQHIHVREARRGCGELEQRRRSRPTARRQGSRRDRAHIGRQLRQFEIDISHFESFSRKTRRHLEDVPAAEFADAVGQARSIAQVARILGVGDTHAFRRKYRARVADQGLNVSHILGQAHGRGVTGGRRRLATDILIANPTSRRRINTKTLRTAMIDVGTPYRCALCATGPDFTLEIDHISGDITDSRPRNLRFLCPTVMRRRRPSVGRSGRERASPGW